MTVAAHPAALRPARVAAALTFAMNGFLFAAWVPHIPVVKHHLGLSDAALGFALLGPACGSMLSLVVVGRLTTTFGSGRVTLTYSLGTYIAATLPGLAGNLPTLFGALFVWGITVGGLDIAMNAQAVQIEKSYGRPIMSSMHACWSLGTVLGAVVGSVGSARHISLVTQQTFLALLFATGTLALQRRFIPDHPVEECPVSGRRFEKRLLLLGLAGLCALVAEGSSGDWSPVYLRDDLHVSAGRTGLAFAAFSTMMTIGRMVGDRVVLSLGRARSLALLSSIGAAGLAAGLLIDTVVSASVGFACLGLGLSVMVPVFFSTAADGPGATGPKLAFVSSVGYLGFLLGPASLGPLASATNVHTALWALPAFTAAAGTLGVVAVRLTARGS